MHPLKQYLQDVEESVADFAKRVGASRQTLYRITMGAQSPKPALARRIIEATGGAVTIEALYNSDGSSRKKIVDFARPPGEAELDHNRIKVAIAIVVNHLSPEEKSGPDDDALNVAAEAVVNTHAALATITSRQGQDRLRQALRPVLGEILQDFAGSVSSPTLDRAAELVTELYYQSWKFDKMGQPSG